MDLKSLRKIWELNPGFIKLAHAISALDKPCKVVAIDGRCASGKTSAAQCLSEMYGACVIHTDDFFLPAAKRTPERMSEYGGNTDYERFENQVIRNLRTGKPFAYDIFDCHMQKITGSVCVEPKNVIIVEGSYSMRPEYGRYYDISAFFDTSYDTQISRVTERSGHASAEAFKSIWIPPENRYFEGTCIKDRADFIVIS